jgi:hypothetical protein
MKMDITPDRNCHRCGGLGWVSYGCIPNAGDPKCDCWHTKTRLEVETEAAVDEANRLLYAGDIAGHQRVLAELAARLEAE